MALNKGLAEETARLCGQWPARAGSLAGGCIAQVYRLEFDLGPPLAAKWAPEGGLTCEAKMLRYLARESGLPVPAVEGASDCLLLLEFLENSGSLDAQGEEEAADHLAALHARSAPAFGFEKHTLIGPLRQPNPWSKAWVPFFRDQRLLYMGNLARQSGNLPGATYDGLEKLAARLEDFLFEPKAPALLHGDLWGGNILAREGRPLAYIDPAIYYGHPEVELAFGTLFGTLGSRFFARYSEHADLAPGFFEERRDLYNLYPLLVHTTLFGGSYGQSVARTLARFL